MVYLALAISCTSVLVSLAFFLLSRQHLKRSELREIRRVVDALATEFDDLRDSMRSTVGRISRLKRSMLDGTETNPGAAPDASVPAPEGVPSGLSPRQQQINSRILARRKGVLQ